MTNMTREGFDREIASMLQEPAWNRDHLSWIAQTINDHPDYFYDFEPDQLEALAGKIQSYCDTLIKAANKETASVKEILLTKDDFQQWKKSSYVRNGTFFAAGFGALLVSASDPKIAFAAATLTLGCALLNRYEQFRDDRAAAQSGPARAEKLRDRFNSIVEFYQNVLPRNEASTKFLHDLEQATRGYMSALESGATPTSGFEETLVKGIKSKPLMTGLSAVALATGVADLAVFLQALSTNAAANEAMMAARQGEIAVGKSINNASDRLVAHIGFAKYLGYVFLQTAKFKRGDLPFMVVIRSGQEPLGPDSTRGGGAPDDDMAP